MKFTVSSTAMTSKLAAMAKVIDSKSTVPVLSTFLLELKEDVLEMTASDLECVWHSSLPVTGQEGAGRICISAGILLDALKNLSEQPVTFLTGDEDKRVCIEYTNGRYDMSGFPADDYPSVVRQGEIRFSLDASVLGKAIDDSMYAVSYDTLRPVMTGINFTVADGKMECAASDGQKLVRNIYPLTEETEGCRFLLPAKAAKIVKTLTQKNTGRVEVSLDERNISFKTDTDNFSSRLVEGTYPNYNAIIPTNSDKEATIERQMLLSAIRRVGAFAEKSSRQLVLNFSGLSLQLTGHDFDNSTSAEENLFCAYQGNGIRISFGADILKLILENMDSDEVRFEMSEPCRAMIIEPASNEEQAEHLALVMPMMLPE